MPNERLLLTIPEAASSIAVSRSTLYRLIDSGQIETLTVRGLKRIRPAALQRFIEQQQRRSREESVNL